ncbi:hypothetical protein [Bartonella taylorii]|nr:hypothetical protein [Bartonella taylorii]
MGEEFAWTSLNNPLFFGKYANKKLLGIKSPHRKYTEENVTQPSEAL